MPVGFVVFAVAVMVLNALVIWSVLAIEAPSDDF